MEHLSIGDTAKLLGVSVSTLRRWEVEKKLLPAYRTVGGHRRYLWQDIQQFCGQFAPELRKTIAYARVSSHDQKDDLERQAQRLEQYCTEQGFDNVTVLKDLGSGLNYHKKKFKQLLRGRLRKRIIKYAKLCEARLTYFLPETTASFV